MSTASASQPFDFSGKVAIHYDECLGPMFFEPYAIEVAKRIDPSDIHLALEIASGTGRVTRHIRENIPVSAKLIASDVSNDMLAIAKEKLKDYDIEWKNIDAQQLPFEDNSVDLVVCCFGYMFVPDRSKALAEAYRVLRPGGMLLFTTWDKLELNAASYICRRIALKYLDNFDYESYNLPFQMNNDADIDSLLRASGFSQILIEHVKQYSVCESAKEAVNRLTRGGFIYNEVEKRNAAWLEELRITAEKELSEKFGEAPMIAPMSAVVIEARK